MSFLSARELHYNMRNIYHISIDDIVFKDIRSAMFRPHGNQLI